MYRNAYDRKQTILITKITQKQRLNLKSFQKKFAEKMSFLNFKEVRHETTCSCYTRDF